MNVAVTRMRSIAQAVRIHIHGGEEPVNLELHTWGCGGRFGVALSESGEAPGSGKFASLSPL
jgi:hypothetical protein